MMMIAIWDKFEINNHNYGPPTQQLGAIYRKLQVDDGRFDWSMKSDQYVKAAVEILKVPLAEGSKELKPFQWPHKGLFPPAYKPKLGTSEECE